MRAAGGGAALEVVNPRQAREFAKGLGRLAKTGRIDAQTHALKNGRGSAAGDYASAAQVIV